MATTVIWNQLGEKLEITFQVISHIISIFIFCTPLVKFHPHHELVLDEVHVLSSSNKDVTGESSLRDVFMNDYWGRPMTNWDSHKSWRPLSVLSFRMLNGGVFSSSINPILVARMVNVVIHAALGEMVSVLALALFPQKENKHHDHHFYTITLRSLTKLLFTLHPSHVEAVANAANRPHLLALMFTFLTLDPSCHILFTAILVTLTAIHWKRKKCVCTMSRELYTRRKKLTQFYSLLHPSLFFRRSDTTEKFISHLLPRYFIVMFIAVCYLLARVLLGTTNIPDGLIRPAENPFYSLKGYKRVLSYSLVLSIHISKLFYTDFVGFSHEYGFNCVPEVSTLKDSRLILPLIVILGTVTISFKVILYVQKQRRANRHSSNLDPLFDLIVAYAWMATLFPISGFIKVGTFIADRIVVASTVMVSVFGGHFLTNWVLCQSTMPSRKSESGHHRVKLSWKLISLISLFAALSKRCMRRSEKWMSSYELLKSSLITCPHSAKSNLELSKCYSGLFPEKQNFELAL